MAFSCPSFFLSFSRSSWAEKSAPLHSILLLLPHTHTQTERKVNVAEATLHGQQMTPVTGHQYSSTLPCVWTNTSNLLRYQVDIFTSTAHYTRVKRRREREKKRSERGPVTISGCEAGTHLFFLLSFLSSRLAQWIEVSSEHGNGILYTRARRRSRRGREKETAQAEKTVNPHWSISCMYTRSCFASRTHTYTVRCVCVWVYERRNERVSSVYKCTVWSKVKCTKKRERQRRSR